MQDRLHDHHEQTLATATVRLNGAKDALEIDLRQRAALLADVDRATTGLQALAIAEAAPDAYIGFLIDWKMPGMDGVECARRILEKHPLLHPRILLVTGFAHDDARRAAGRRAAQAGDGWSVCTIAWCERAGSNRPHRSPPGARVLLAEDHPLDQQLACGLLRRAGMEVVVAEDGREALDKLEREGPFESVLMDCPIPVMDGDTATRDCAAATNGRTRR